MILQELCKCYEVLAQDPDSGVARVNYSSIPCSFAFVISRSGDLQGVIPLVEEKKRTYLVVPEQKGRSGKNPPPYFLCDNAKYLLGYEYDKKNKVLVPTEERLLATYAYYREIQGDSQDIGLEAVMVFLKKRLTHEPLDLRADHPVFQGGNIVFRFEKEGYVHDRPVVKALWEQFCEQNSHIEQIGQCLVTGEESQKIAKTHTFVKGVMNAKATGSALVSFNFPSALSYGKTQSYNAPVSEKAMFAYTTALNYLLANKKNRARLADTTVVFWASTPREQDVMSFFLAEPESDVSQSEEDAIIEEEIAQILQNVREGRPISEIGNPQSTTFVLGLAPNAARTSVRFWYANTFYEFMVKMADHQEKMQIQKPDTVPKYVTISQILREITPKSQKWWENVPASYEQALFQAILSGSRYPRSVYTAVLMRIRAEAGEDYSINAIRVGYLKAVLIRNFNEKGLTMSLDMNSTDTAYSLGRLFAVLEALQAKANGSSTIRSRYFASASVNPKLVFPSLLNLAQHHIQKIPTGGYYDMQIEKILSIITNFPANFSLEEQGKFILGYYQQREFLYMKKDDKEKMEA